MKAARHSVDIDVRPARVYALITDFASYPGFVPNQSATRVLSSGEADGVDLWRVEFELSVARTLHYTLDLRGVPGESLRWSLLAGDMMKENEGGWALTPLDGGARTRADYDINVVFKGFVPRSISRILIERTLPDNLAAFKHEAERRG